MGCVSCDGGEMYCSKMCRTLGENVEGDMVERKKDVQQPSVAGDGTHE